jgi:hypothetical protein
VQVRVAGAPEAVGEVGGVGIATLPQPVTVKIKTVRREALSKNFISRLSKC